MSEENLRTEMAQLKQQLAEQNKMISELQNENKRLHTEIAQLRKELRKYKNENTPSGALPPYLKDELRKISQHNWSLEGMKGLAVMQSLYETCKLRNENFMDLVKNEVEANINDRKNY